MRGVIKHRETPCLVDLLFSPVKAFSGTMSVSVEVMRKF